MSIKNTIIGEIVKNAKIKWDNLNIEQAINFIEGIDSSDKANKEVTYGSEIKAVDAITSICDLTQQERQTLIEDIYTKKEISTELSDKISRKILDDKFKNIFEILSHIHNEWVKNNSNNFLNRPKDFQFVDLKLLPYEEVLSDLIFLQPILEGCGIDIDDEILKKEFYNGQIQFLQDSGIKSHDSLVKKLMEGSDFYSSLNNLRTTRDGETVLIDDIIRNLEVAESMANQIEQKICLQKTDLHTHLNAVLPSKVMADLSLNLLGKKIEPSTLELYADVNIWNRLQEANGIRKQIENELISNGYGNEFLTAIAKNYKKYGIEYVELTTDIEVLKKIKTEEINIDLIEKETGVKLRFLLGFNRNNLKLETFNNSEVQNVFVENPYLVRTRYNAVMKNTEQN